MSRPVAGGIAATSAVPERDRFGLAWIDGTDLRFRELAVVIFPEFPDLPEPPDQVVAEGLIAFPRIARSSDGTYAIAYIVSDSTQGDFPFAESRVEVAVGDFSECPRGE